MSNPYLVQVPFCVNGNKNTIQLTRQPTQDPEDATYDGGFPPETMIPTASGGLPPKGLDFNGIFYELSSPIAHYCRGDRIQFDAAYASAIGGYAKGAILASNDYQKDYISLVDNNTADPNGSNTTWAVYAGQGSVPTATSTTTGTVKLANSLSSTATDAALTAAMGKDLNDKMIGVGQTWQLPVRAKDTTYTNTTKRPIFVMLGIQDPNDTAGLTIVVGGVTILNVSDFGAQGTHPISFIVPAGNTYRVNATTNTIRSWAELR